jgi:tetratricopeptide (TPR) repeat protein
MSTLIDTAIAHHQAGRLADAESIYRRLIEDDPANADALHLLGVVALQRGNASESVDLISQALGFNPTNAVRAQPPWRAHRALKFPEDAIVCFERAIKLKPDLFQAYNNLGNTHQSQARPVWRSCVTGKRWTSIRAMPMRSSTSATSISRWETGASASTVTSARWRFDRISPKRHSTWAMSSR